ncbi:uncharacterized protein LOC135946904 [Cloeon dipterum]|uniref:uncharacterized protein LOC135946904 n=1 Tax=Cloeon dipterum TaxID=197152 RepID=UPI00322015D8
MVVFFENIPRISWWCKLYLLLVMAVATWWVVSLQKELSELREENRLLRPIAFQKQGFVYQNSKPLDKVAMTEMDQEDEALVRIVRDMYLIPPATIGYNLSDPKTRDHSMGQGEKIRQTLGEMKGGFFIECGALDGETRSNSLYFERFLDWKGLLVEADPLNIQEVVQKRRKAWLAPTCLSLKRKPQLVKYMQARNIGRILGTKEHDNFKGSLTDLLCIPITTLLLALDKKRVDYFSLDVEGNELDVLRTIDFNKFDIRTLSVEFSNIKEGKDALLRHMMENGYILHSNVTRYDNLANDFIFVKKLF